MNQTMAAKCKEVQRQTAGTQRLYYVVNGVVTMVHTGEQSNGNSSSSQSNK